MEGFTREIEKLKTIIYKITRGKELNERERDVIDGIIEDRDYREEFS